MSIEILDRVSAKPFEETLKWAIEIKDKTQKIKVEGSFTILLIFGGIICCLFLIWFVLVAWSSSSEKKSKDDESSEYDFYSDDESEYEDIIDHMSQAHIPMADERKPKSPVQIPPARLDNSSAQPEPKAEPKAEIRSESRPEPKSDKRSEKKPAPRVPVPEPRLDQGHERRPESNQDAIRRVASPPAIRLNREGKTRQ